MTESLLVLTGGPALSRFRLDKTLASARAEVPELDVLYGEWLHLLLLRGELTADERGRVDDLLQYGPREALPVCVGEPFCTVLPRAGTISPWSSKATDIFAICGLEKVARVERGVRWRAAGTTLPADALADALGPLLHDRMTQTLVRREEDYGTLFGHHPPRRFRTIELRLDAARALHAANAELGLALSDDEIAYLVHAYEELGRDPTDVELMMFAQANSEHCRHKIFNASWLVDGRRADYSLFELIKSTHRHINGAGILSAYTDNAAVIEGHVVERFARDAMTHRYDYAAEPVHIVMKVETHNHPTAIAPHPGAATGSGGEIRDEGSVGRGSKPKAGLTGFTTSHLEMPGDPQPWELSTGYPNWLSSALTIMLEAPIGAAGYNNEYGRPALTGYFRTFEQTDPNDSVKVRGYHKPVMIAGGVGSIRELHVRARPAGTRVMLVVLGGPAMLIGLGGGAASSMASGESTSELDYASVQRDNAEMERRCQEVIDACTALGEENPISRIHDVGAGGLANAVPELVKDAGTGGRIELRNVPTAEPGMSPLELWCNEAQERYVLSIAPERLAQFEAICRRERCPFAVIGETRPDGRLVVEDRLFHERPVDVPLSVLFGRPPKLTRSFTRRGWPLPAFVTPCVTVAQALERVLRFPAVGSKRFLVTIGDRSIGGCVARDQMVGPWQVPVADAAVTLAGYRTYAGEAMAMGERPPLALLDPAASVRIAIGEAMTNLASVVVTSLARVVLSANWMAAAGSEREDQALFDGVNAAAELCRSLGIAIPVGKDSLSMRARWATDGTSMEVSAPLTLNVTAFAPVPDVRRHATPQLRLDAGKSRLLLLDLGLAKDRMGGSALAQTHRALGGDCPDVDDPRMLAASFETLQSLIRDDLVLAYHDRSDGGLAVTLLEMAFAGRCGLELDVAQLIAGDASDQRVLRAMFAEELGAVVQVRETDLGEVLQRIDAAGLGDCVREIGAPCDGDRIEIRSGDRSIFSSSRSALERCWAETSHRLQRLRDNPACADSEHALIGEADPGMSVHLSFAPGEDVAAPCVARGARPRVAVLREQGVNGQLEMAAAFERAGFEPVDVHMSDLLSGSASLRDFAVLAACGGFSYGDVLGGGGGWAKAILYNARAREEFAAFFARDTLTLGICNGCQMLSQLKDLIPGADGWPRFVRNASEQFEARSVLVRIADSSSPWLDGMVGSVVPIAVAHGEGRVEASAEVLTSLERNRRIAAQFVDSHHRVTERYPFNPNGSAKGIAGVASADGRALVLMPHPERVFRSVQSSWHPAEWGEDGPWLRLFRNARRGVG